MSETNPAPRLFTIAPELPFADALVDGLLYGGLIALPEDDPLAKKMGKKCSIFQKEIIR